MCTALYPRTVLFIFVMSEAVLKKKPPTVSVFQTKTKNEIIQYLTCSTSPHLV